MIMNRPLLRWGYTLMLLLGLMSCGFRESTKPLSAEEMRLERIHHLDSTILHTTILPDSIDQLSAESWILVDDSSNMIIAAKNADKRMFMASLTKMMTCLLVLEHGNMGDTIHITEDVFLARDSRVRLGEGYLLGDLLCEMMLQSDNDAATALAKHIGGDVPTFCEMMNRKADYLGMDSTHFANPNGMPNDSNYSTARDLLVLTRYCMGDSVFSKMVSTPFMKIPLIDGRHMSCYNTNLLLEKYEGCIGVKTGYTRQAGSCLASAAIRNGVRLYLILLNSRSRSSRFKESAIILDYGFQVMESPVLDKEKGE